MSLLDHMRKELDAYNSNLEFEVWLTIAEFEALVVIAEAARDARGQLNRQIPHSQRTQAALKALSVVDMLDENPFAPRKPKPKRVKK